MALTRREAAFAKGALGLALFLAAWQASVPMVGLESYFYPSPRDVLVAFGDLVRKGILPVYLVRQPSPLHRRGLDRRRDLASRPGF